MMIKYFIDPYYQIRSSTLKRAIRFLSLLVIVSVFMAVAGACSATPSQATQDTSSGAAPASSDGAVKIDSYKLLQDNGSGAAGDEVKSFKASQHVQYFDVSLSGFLKPGTAVKWVYTAVDTTAGKDVKITEADVTVVIGNKLTSTLKMDQDFPVGTYKIDILTDGKPLGTINYTVEQ